MRFLSALIVLIIIIISNTPAQTDCRNQLSDGDLIFQTSISAQSEAIERATDSKYSHVGIIFSENDELYVWEAVEPVKKTPIEEWIERGKDDHYAVKRLKNADSVLTPSVLNEMKEIGKQFMGKGYDYYFGWSDKKIYCSEFVWKLYQRASGIGIGTPQQLRDFNLSDPVVKEQLRKRYGKNPPLNETVVSPADIFNSDTLEMVCQKN